MRLRRLWMVVGGWRTRSCRLSFILVLWYVRRYGGFSYEKSVHGIFALSQCKPVSSISSEQSPRAQPAHTTLVGNLELEEVQRCNSSNVVMISGVTSHLRIGWKEMSFDQQIFGPCTYNGCFFLDISPSAQHGLFLCHLPGLREASSSSRGGN